MKKILLLMLLISTNSQVLSFSVKNYIYNNPKETLGVSAVGLIVLYTIYCMKQELDELKTYRDLSSNKIVELHNENMSKSDKLKGLSESEQRLRVQNNGLQRSLVSANKYLEDSNNDLLCTRANFEKMRSTAIESQNKHQEAVDAFDNLATGYNDACQNVQSLEESRTLLVQAHSDVEDKYLDVINVLETDLTKTKTELFSANAIKEEIRKDFEYANDCQNRAQAELDSLKVEQSDQSIQTDDSILKDKNPNL